MYNQFLAVSAIFALAALPLDAQSDTSRMSMPVPRTLIGAELQHGSSGTSIEPPSTPMPMLMRQQGSWTFMLHANLFVADTQQHAQNDRGGDKLFSTNWMMPMAQHRLGPAGGLLTLRTMLSLEPATITGRFYPELFQQGENRVWKADRGRSTSSRFLHGTRRAL